VPDQPEVRMVITPGSFWKDEHARWRTSHIRPTFRNCPPLAGTMAPQTAHCPGYLFVMFCFLLLWCVVLGYSDVASATAGMP
jgi:hypothetical protein